MENIINTWFDLYFAEYKIVKKNDYRYLYHESEFSTLTLRISNNILFYDPVVELDFYSFFNEKIFKFEDEIKRWSENLFDQKINEVISGVFYVYN